MGQARARVAAPRARGARGRLHVVRARLPAQCSAEAAHAARGRRDVVDVAAAAQRGGAGGAPAGRGGAPGGARAAPGRARGGAGAARGAAGRARGRRGPPRAGRAPAARARAAALLTDARHHPRRRLTRDGRSVTVQTHEVLNRSRTYALYEAPCKYSFSTWILLIFETESIDETSFYLYCFE